MVVHFTTKGERKYVICNITSVDLLDMNGFLVQIVNDIMKELGYSATKVRYHCLKPRTNLDYGFVSLCSDQDVKDLLKYVARNKVIDLYIEYDSITLDTYFNRPRDRVLKDHNMPPSPFDIKGLISIDGPFNPRPSVIYLGNPPLLRPVRLLGKGNEIKIDASGSSKGKELEVEASYNEAEYFDPFRDFDDILRQYANDNRAIAESHRMNILGMHASLYMVQELRDQVRLERWQGMVRARAAKSDKDGLLSVQEEESAFFLMLKGASCTQRKVSSVPFVFSIPFVLSRGGSISPDSFLSSTLLSVVMVVAIVGVVIVVTIIGVVVVDIVGGVPSIIKLSFVIVVQELGDQVRLERWQGTVRARAARCDKDGLLSVQEEESAFFLVPKVMTRLGVTRRVVTNDDSDGFVDEQNIINDVAVDMQPFKDDMDRKEALDLVDSKRRKMLRELRKKGKSIDKGMFDFFVDQRFDNRELVKDRIRKHSVDYKAFSEE
uniref:PB1-like domain-containing protein n=1 Tax=Tanacetum cinerariifolium TaxID=118510 RepID=A0A6L2K2C5_TANCI|nr:hypothetical protein [Tanacetum cinerariifolium]